MLKNCSIWTAAWLSLCCGFFGAFGSAQLKADFPYIVDQVPEEWLPQSSVFALVQTRDGYLWLGTHDGLVRFDGLKCTVFTEANLPELRSSPIVYLHEDSRSNLWVGTQTAGLVVIQRDGSVKRIDIDRTEPVGPLLSMGEDISGALWLNTRDGRVARYYRDQLEILEVRARPILPDRSGLLWLSVMQQGIAPQLLGLAPVPHTNLYALQHTLPLANVDSLVAVPEGGFWCLANGRVGKWTNNQLARDLGPYPWGDSQVTAACLDRQGQLVVGTQDKGVFWFQPDGKATQISGRNGLSHDTALSVCVDREGALWVGTDSGGLNRVRRKLFNVQQDSLGLTIQSVCDDREGGIWSANFGGKLSHWRDGTLTQYDVGQGAQNPYIRSVFVDRDRQVWVGTTLEGLFMKRDDVFERVAVPQAGRSVSAIFEDRAGRLWLGTDNGLARHEDSASRVFTTQDGLSAIDIRALAEDKDGNLWIGTEGGGLNCLSETNFSVLHKEHGLPSENITSLFVDRDGVLWIGTAAGLARLEKQSGSNHTARGILAGNSIGYIIEDDQGYLWLGSNAGLMRVAKSELNDAAQGKIPPEALSPRVYGQIDGLPRRECSQGSQPATCRTPDGTLFFCTIRGLASVNPATIQPNPLGPPVVIESVLVDSQEQITNILSSGALRKVIIPANKEHLDIEYTSLNLAAPDRARFRYRLEGHESAWTEADSTRVARFSNLPPGQYQFHVIACNEDGVWNHSGASVGITVLPPFWRTWWFISLNAVALLALLIFSVRFVSTQKLQRQLAILKQQDMLEKERARIARDLHDQLGANLTQVSILSEMAAGDKDQPNEVEAHTQQISQTARETTHALDEIVWAINPSNDTLEGLITYACKYAQDYLATAALRLRLDVPTQLPDVGIPPELRHNVFLAFKEALNNVVKHARATETRIRLVLQDGSFILEIQDNGCGPGNAETKQGRNGLRNMRKRMQDVGGNFSIHPAPDGGTRVQLVVPVANR